MPSELVGRHDDPAAKLADGGPAHRLRLRDRRRLKAGLSLLKGDTLLFWVCDLTDLDRRSVVELLGDGKSLGFFKADSFVASLYDEGCGDGCYGHYLALEADHPVELFELCLCNHEGVLASLNAAEAMSKPTSAPVSFGRVSWRGGLRLSGELINHRFDINGIPTLQLFEGSRRLIVEPRYLPGTENGSTSVQFDVLLPPAMADGQAHQLRVITEDGAELTGSPLSVFAHRGGYRGLLAEGHSTRPLRRFQSNTLAMLDQLIPASVGFEQYPVWREAFERETPAVDETAPVRTIAVIIVGKTASAATLASLREQKGQVSLKVAFLNAAPDTSQFSGQEFESVCRVLRVHEPDAWMMVRSGTMLRPSACHIFAHAVAGGSLSPTDDIAELCLADHEIFGPDGAVTPLFWPVFDQERLLSQGYGEGLFAFRSPPAMAAEAATLFSTYDVLFHIVRQAGCKPGSVAHVPTILASVPQRPVAAATTLLSQAAARHQVDLGMPAEVIAKDSKLLPLVAIRRAPPDGRVGIIIPTRDRLDLLQPCIESLLATSRHADCQIMIVDNGSVERETEAYLRKCRRWGLVVIRDEKPFNYARLNNDAVKALDTPFICFLNNDVEVRSPDWLDVMKGYFARQDVGGVGAKLTWPNGMLQHGGVVIGLNYAAGHGYDRYLASEAGYAEGILTTRECSALTAACLLVRRADFLAVGGFDAEAFPVAFNDVDLCLKLRQAGKVLIWTPDAELLHHESASRRGDWGLPSKLARADKELAELRRRWGPALMSDPYYNPNLNLDAYPYTGLALPPRETPSICRRMV